MEPDPKPSYRPLFLIGEHDISLDDKSRLLVPAEFRKEIGEARDNEKVLICRIGANRNAWLYPENYYRELIARRLATLTPGEDEEAFNEAYYGMVFRLQWDGQGRVLLPEKLIKRTALRKELTIVGSGDHLVIWNRDEWERRAQLRIETMPQITEKAKQTDTTRPVATIPPAST
jgi:MraZ protein